MYICYGADRKRLRYVNNISCETNVAFIFHSPVQDIKKISSDVKNGNGKIRRKIVALVISTSVFFSYNREAEGIVQSVVPMVQVVEKVSYNYHNNNLIYAPTISPSINKIVMPSYEQTLPLIFINGHHAYINEQLLKKLRAGNLSGNLTLMVIGAVVCIIFQASGGGVDAFSIWQQFSQWNAPTISRPPSGPPMGGVSSYPGSPTSLPMVDKPSDMPGQEFDGLSSEERRALPHPLDIKIDKEGYPKLIVGYWQAKRKVRDHGAVHYLEWILTNKGETRTMRTPENILAMMRSIADMPNRPKHTWILDGRYQDPDPEYAGSRKSTRGFPAIHIIDQATRVIAVFKKETGEFVTTCQMSTEEYEEILETGNFGGGPNWLSGTPKNVPPDFTPRTTSQTAVNTFESDVMEISTIDANSPSNEGFTPTSSFESDVMNITPVDNSTLDNP